VRDEQQEKEDEMQPLHITASLVDLTFGIWDDYVFASIRILFNASEGVFITELDHECEYKPIHTMDQVMTLSQDQTCRRVMNSHITGLFAPHIPD
jgi:hypothetical protein